LIFTQNAPTFGSGFTDSAASTAGLTFATASAAASSSAPTTASGTEADWKKYGEGEERTVNKRKWEGEDTAPTTTGEEEESNVLQVSKQIVSTYNTRL